MKKQLLFLVLILSGLTVYSQSDCIKCSSEPILKLVKTIEKPTEQTVNCFLETFGEECKNNVEFSEWSNEVLYDLLEKHPDKLITALESNKQIDKTEILKEIKGPLFDENYDLILKNLSQLDRSHSRDLVSLAVEIAKSFRYKYIPENANTKMIGKWQVKEENGPHFEIELFFKNGQVKGNYCGYPSDLSKLDCPASDEAKDCPIQGIIEENQVVILFTSCYSNTTGKAIIEMSGDKLIWKTMINPDGWFFAPYEADLFKVK